MVLVLGDDKDVNEQLSRRALKTEQSIKTLVRIILTSGITSDIKCFCAKILADLPLAGRLAHWLA